MAVKRQFSEFDRYFEINVQDGIKFISKEPVLKFKDVEKLFGPLPEPFQINPVEIIMINLIKEYQQRNISGLEENIPVQLIFKDGKLAEVHFMRESLKNLSQCFIHHSLKSLGQANIQKRAKLVTNTVIFKHLDNCYLLHLSDFNDALGSPYSIKNTIENLKISYRYIIQTTDNKDTPKKIYMTASFSKENILKFIDGKIHGINIRLNYGSSD
ncbi:MAG: hypothetical protein A2161_01430 [Candidatus Schekmanbacteria bacterium RBG_13_48_7]|uniref:Uncharacterized protein n=1 Tax=Candidatus Schekmanbacteria bacterium RBG_13_48_7 TaxID=1817878 RepID=A0A1F7RS38_9BACT|nr:MAG: hypothetical protein A2161_01430 [Candidatus Schekmanbacteria bacterium RBG_13_48_7]